MNNQFSGTAEHIIGNATENSQMLQENAGDHPSLSHAVTTDEQTLRAALEGQRALIARNPQLQAAERALTQDPAPDDPQTGAKLDISKRIG